MASAIELGRDAFRRRAWREAFVQLSAADVDAGLAIEDMERLATAAYLTGDDDCVDLWARAYQRCLAAGEAARAARCAGWAAYALFESGEVARGSGWLSRAEVLIDEGGVDCAERGWLLVPQAFACFADDPAGALEGFAAAVEIAERFGDRDLAALAGMGHGQALIALGAHARAMPVLDEAMVAVTAGEVSPIVAGSVLCGAIDACQAVLDVRRAREWTVALSRWCDGQPDLVPFRGQCLVHRAEIMQLHGDWQDALEEAERACECLSGTAAAGDALYRLAELQRVRGDVQHAEETYRAATNAGAPAAAGLGPATAGSRTGRRRGRGDTPAGGRDRRRSRSRTGVGTVRRDHARRWRARRRTRRRGRAERHCRRGRHGLPVRARLPTPQGRCAWRKATRSVRSPSSARPGRHGGTSACPTRPAKVRVLIGLACRAVGDADTAAMELDAARVAFASLGAGHDVARVEQLLRDEPTRRPGGLTDRELEVLVQVARGSTNRAIAAALVISEHTVARHIQNILTKLGVSSRTGRQLLRPRAPPPVAGRVVRTNHDRPAPETGRLRRCGTPRRSSTLSSVTTPGRRDRMLAGMPATGEEGIMADELWRLGAAELAGLIRKREVASREVVDAHLRRIEAVNGSVQRDHRRRSPTLRSRRPTQADAMLAAGGEVPPLHGVPFTVKENIDLTGSATTQGLVAVRGDASPTATPLTSPSFVPPAPSRWPARTCPTSGFRWHTDNALRGPTVEPLGQRRGHRAAPAAARRPPSRRGCRRSAWATTTAGPCASPPSSAASRRLRPTLGRVPDATAFAPEDFPITLQLMAVQGPMARRVADLRLALATHVRRGPAGSVVDTRSPRRSAAPAAGRRVAGRRRRRRGRRSRRRRQRARRRRLRHRRRRAADDGPRRPGSGRTSSPPTPASW